MTNTAATWSRRFKQAISRKNVSDSKDNIPLKAASRDLSRTWNVTRTKHFLSVCYKHITLFLFNYFYL